MTGQTLKRLQQAAPFLVLSGVILLGAYSGLSTDSGETLRLPFDPLDAEEQQTAVEIAIADPEVQALLDRYVTIGAALNTDKHRLQTDPSSRAADVWFYDYTIDQTVHVLVDLKAETVASWLLADYQPPLAVQEAARAETLALQHDEVTDELDARADDRELQTIARLWSMPVPHPCADHRCVLVGFFLGDSFQSDLGALVDLSTDQALGLYHPEEHGHKEVTA